MGIWRHGEQHKESIPSDPAGGCGVQPGWKHSLQISWRGSSEPGKCSLLHQRVSRLQRTTVS